MFKKNATSVVFGMLVVCLMSVAVSGATITFDSTTGLAGWTTVYGVVPGSLSDGVDPAGAIGLSTNTGYAVYEPLNTLLFYTDKANLSASPFIPGVGAFTTASPDPALVLQLEGSYVAVRYTAPAGEVVTSITVPNVYYFDGYAPVTLQIADAVGNVIASQAGHAAGPITVANLTATGLSASSVEIRLANVGGGQWGAAYWATNGVAMDKVIVTTAIPEPATMGLLGLGVLGLLRRKRA